ncbi:MAG: hypothetical protein HUU32_19650 [Calditrichaceae bacterium]|nr:hypothetical protein [Calditrichia bacterium]NUQ43612.1 hypothetical protein [Calditrichaceae bacterium]
MKKYLLTLFVFAATTIFAQEVDSFIELLRSDVKTQKKGIITEVMEFSEAEAAAFWPVYRNYEVEQDKLADARIALIKDYAANYKTMVDAKATELMDKAFKFREERLKLQKKYFKEFSKILSPTKAAKWAQLEDQITLLIDLQIASELPLAEKPSEQ